MIWRHALPATSVVPLVTVIALSYAGLLEGSVLTETVFALAGPRPLPHQLAAEADMNAVLGGTLIDRRRLHRRQHVLRPALPPARPEDALSSDRVDRTAAGCALAADARAGSRGCRRGSAASIAAGGASAAIRWRWSASSSSLVADRSSRCSRRCCAHAFADRAGPGRRGCCRPSAAHWFGTDDLGRDIFSRIVYGSRITLTIVVLVAVIVGADRPARSAPSPAISAAGSTRC